MCIREQHSQDDKYRFFSENTVSFPSYINGDIRGLLPLITLDDWHVALVNVVVFEIKSELEEFCSAVTNRSIELNINISSSTLESIILNTIHYVECNAILTGYEAGSYSIQPKFTDTLYKPDNDLGPWVGSVGKDASTNGTGTWVVAVVCVFSVGCGLRGLHGLQDAASFKMVVSPRP